MNRTMHKSAFEKSIKVMEAAVGIISRCRTHLWELRNRVREQGVMNDREEIHFFKRTKQTPMVNLIYHSEKVDLGSNHPTTTLNTQKKWIQ